MASTETSVVLQSTMHFAYKKQGWTEKLYFAGANYEDGMATAQRLLKRRRKLLPQNCEVVWAKLNFRGGPREARRLGSFPQLGLASAPDDELVPGLLTSAPDAFPDAPTTALMYRLETEEGKWANRYLHCLPDSVIANFNLAAAVTIPEDPAVTADAASATWYTALGDYLADIRNSTKFVSEIANGEEDFLIDDIDDVSIQKITSHKVGRPFGALRGSARIS